MTDKGPKAEDVAPVVYDELRRVAAAYMRRERPGQTLQATALVHEAYLRLAQAGTPWHDQRHFVGIAARSMRQILVERARARGAQKRWGGMNRVSITDSLALAADPETMLPALDEAISKLEALDAEQAKIVELRVLCRHERRRGRRRDGDFPGHIEAAMDACAGMAVPGVIAVSPLARR